MYSLNSAAQKIVSYWETQRDIPFKGQLITKDGNENVCMKVAYNVIMSHKNS
jgi:hypothetical protein